MQMQLAMRDTSAEQPVPGTLLTRLRAVSAADLAADEEWRFAPVPSTPPYVTTRTAFWIERPGCEGDALVLIERVGPSAEHPRALRVSCAARTHST